jgi:hypothetical protein
MTPDYKRNGTTTLFTALDTSRGTVITSCKARHRVVEFLAFMKDVASQPRANSTCTSSSTTALRTSTHP